MLTSEAYLRARKQQTTPCAKAANVFALAGFLAVNISAIVISIQNENNPCPTSDAAIAIPYLTWLFWYGVTSLIGITVLVCCVLRYVLSLVSDCCLILVVRASSSVCCCSATTGPVGWWRDSPVALPYYGRRFSSRGWSWVRFCIFTTS